MSELVIIKLAQPQLSSMVRLQLLLLVPVLYIMTDTSRLSSSVSEY